MTTMESYCQSCSGLTTHILVNTGHGKATWACKPCLALGPYAAGQALRDRRRHSITIPEAFDEWLSTQREAEYDF